jgi:hypothetical protein
VLPRVGLHSLPGVTRLVTWTIPAVTWTLPAAIDWCLVTIRPTRGSHSLRGMSSDWLRAPYWVSSFGCVLTHNNKQRAVKSANPKSANPYQRLG